MIATSGYQDGLVHYWRLGIDLGQQRPPLHLQGTKGQNLIHFLLTPRGNLIVAAWEGDTAIQLLDSVTGAVNTTIDLSSMLVPQRVISKYVTSIGMSPKEELLAVWLDYGIVGLWDTSTGTRVRSYSHNPGTVYSIFITADCTKMATMTTRGFRIVDIAADEEDHGPANDGSVHREHLFSAELQFISDTELIKIGNDEVLETYNVSTATVTD